MSVSAQDYRLYIIKNYYSGHMLIIKIQTNCTVDIMLAVIVQVAAVYDYMKVSAYLLAAIVYACRLEG